jgi:hypothetical protein
VDTRNIATATQAQHSARRSTVRQRIVSLGVLLIFGGETFCLLGPMRYEHVVHITCHAVFYIGIMFVCFGAVMHRTGKR